MRRRTFLRTVGLVGASTTASGCVTAGDAATRTLLGAYPGANAPSPSTFEPFERWLGRTNAVLSLFYDADVLPGNESIVLDELTTVWETGHVPMIAWQPYWGAPDETAADIERHIHNGDYADVVHAWTHLLADYVTGGEGPDRRLYFRPLPEMNGDWVPWGAVDSTTTPRDFVLAWQYLRDAFADEGLTAHNVQWIWNPNARGSDGPAAEEYYPGDDATDWVGVDGYNFGESQPWSAWQSPESVFGPFLDRVGDFSARPLAFPEFASSSLRDGGYAPRAKARWIDEVFALIRRRDVRMVCWFNLDKETDWPVFGGPRGTDSVSLDGTPYPVYEAYRRAVTDDGLVTAETGNDRLLADEVFRGEW